MKTKTKSLCALVTLYLALLHAADLEAQRGYTATDLGTLSNGHTSYALALNNQGQVVGYADTGEVDPNSGAPIIHGFLWENVRSTHVARYSALPRLIFLISGTSFGKEER
jgi:probable HAF family extracellular repeat protein